VGCDLLFGLQSFLFSFHVPLLGVFFPVFIYFYVVSAKISSNPRISRNLLFAWELWLDIFLWNFHPLGVVRWVFSTQIFFAGPNLCSKPGGILYLRLITGRPQWND
jgi:hypothetical protein